jgi:protein O-GlcNAc transferase
MLAEAAASDERLPRQEGDRHRLDSRLIALPSALRSVPPSATASSDALHSFEHGNLLLSQGKLDEAIDAFDRALALEPRLAAAHINLGNALLKLGQPAAAAACYANAIAIDPRTPQAHNNLGCALFLLGQLGAAIHHHKEAIALAPAAPSAYANLLLALHYVPGVPKALIAEAARRWSQKIRRPASRGIWQWRPKRGGRLRIGYVSGDFRTHPVAYFIEGILAAHDRAAVEVFCYSNSLVTDAATQRLKSASDRWRDISRLSDDEAWRRIALDRIDILVDLSGHTADNRLALFAMTPAPIQCTWLGYVGTTGLPEIDYIIADRFVLPEADEQFYSERPYRLPHSYLCFTPPDASADVAPPPALDRGTVTFGCFNNLLKINGAVVTLWSNLLAAVPGSRLVLKAAQLGDAATREGLAGEFAARGVGVDRLVLEPASPREELLAAYNKIDIALDPFPYGGGTTTLEALWMGVPVITLRGDSFVGRVGESILTTIGHSELVADSPSQYLAVAAALANDIARLTRMRGSLHQRLVESPLCRSASFVGELERAYAAMWEEWCRSRKSAA